MALVQVQFFSKALARQVDIQVLLPNDSQEWMTKDNPHYERPMRTLYLLHGYSGSHRDWLINSRIMELSGKYNLAVVMPSGENSFYLDQAGSGNAYGTFVGSELPAYVAATFSLSTQREHNFICGLSMGGFGAIHVGVSHAEAFSKIGALSSALIIHGIKHMQPGTKNEIADYDYYVRVFGELSKLEASTNNPETVIKALKEAQQPIPDFYMACGAEDFLIEPNRAFHQFLLQQQVNVHYVEGSGSHDFNYWNFHLEPAIAWMLKGE